MATDMDSRFTVLGRFCISPQKPHAGSFEDCPPEDATQWAVFKQTEGSIGPNDFDWWCADFDSKAAALAYVLARS